MKRFKIILVANTQQIVLATSDNEEFAKKVVDLCNRDMPGTIRYEMREVA